MSLNNIEEISFCIHQDAPKIHCLTVWSQKDDWL